MSLSVVLVGFLYASAAFFVVLALAALGRRETPGARPFSILMLAVALYLGAYAVELSSSNVNEGLLALRFEYLGLAPMPVLWFLFARSYTGRPSLRFGAILPMFPGPRSRRGRCCGAGEA